MQTSQIFSRNSTKTFKTTKILQSPISDFGNAIRKFLSPISNSGNAIRKFPSPISNSGNAIWKFPSPISNFGNATRKFPSSISNFGNAIRKFSSPISNSGNATQNVSSPISDSGNATRKFLSPISNFGNEYGLKRGFSFRKKLAQLIILRVFSEKESKYFLEYFVANLSSNVISNSNEFFSGGIIVKTKCPPELSSI